MPLLMFLYIVQRDAHGRLSHFLVNQQAHDYEVLVEELLKAYEKLACRVSLEIRVLHSHLPFWRPISEQ